MAMGSGPGGGQPQPLRISGILISLFLAALKTIYSQNLLNDTS